MATKNGHQALEDTSDAESESDGALPDTRITAYHDSEGSDNVDDNADDTQEQDNDNIELQTVSNALGNSDAKEHEDDHDTLPLPVVLGDYDGTIDGDGDTLDEQDTTQQNGYPPRDTNTNTGNYSNNSRQYDISMYRIWQLLSMTTIKGVLYMCAIFNGISFFVGALANTRGLGTLWFRADYTIEYEYSFGWYKSVELEGDWTPVDYESLDGYFDTGIVEAGDFFGLTVILGLIFLIILALWSICKNLNGNKRSTPERRADSNICSGVLLGLSLIYFLVYVIAILTFHTEFEDVCGELIGILDTAHKFYHKQDLDHYECSDGWAMYLQYANILIYVLSMILCYEVRKGNIAIQVAKEARNFTQNDVAFGGMP